MVPVFGFGLSPFSSVDEYRTVAPASPESLTSDHLRTLSSAGLIPESTATTRVLGAAHDRVELALERAEALGPQS